MKWAVPTLKRTERWGGEERRQVAYIGLKNRKQGREGIKISDWLGYISGLI